MQQFLYITLLKPVNKLFKVNTSGTYFLYLPLYSLVMSDFSTLSRRSNCYLEFS